MKLAQIFWKNEKLNVPVPLPSQQDERKGKPVRVILLPGNGFDDVNDDDFWYSWLSREMFEKLPGVQCVLEDFPDPMGAKESLWKAFVLRELEMSPSDILVGHSSGAECAMRLAEEYKVGGLILISACWTDLGEASERRAGYYSRPWRWEKIKQNAGFIVQFASKDDPFVPFEEEQAIVAKHLSSELKVYNDKGHFNTTTDFPELLEVLIEKLRP